MGEYTFTLTDRAGGGAELVSDVTFAPRGRYRMCRPTMWTTEWPTSGPDAIGPLATNKRMLQVRRDGQLVHNGILRKLNAKGDGDKARVACTFLDPMVWWPFRMLRDATGNYAYPTFANPITVGELLFESITNAIAFDGGGGYGMGIALGTDTTTKNVYSTLGNFPMKIGELASLLASTGMGEWWVTPIASGNVYGRLDVEERMGGDRSGSVQFVYDEDGNCSSASYDEDGDQVVTALRYLLGAKTDEEHWQASVDGGLYMPDPPQSAIDAAWDAARAEIGWWFDLRVFEDADVWEGDAPNTSNRVMWRRIFQLEASLRVRPKRLAAATPIAAGGSGTPGPVPFDDYFLGDIVSADLTGLGPVADGGYVVGDQRVYGFDVGVDDESGAERSTVITSPDGEEVVG